MILYDRKKALSQIMGPSPEEEVHEDPAHAIAKEAIEAVHAKDHEGFANATKALFMHYSGEHDGNASEEHDEE